MAAKRSPPPRTTHTMHASQTQTAQCPMSAPRPAGYPSCHPYHLPPGFTQFFIKKNLG
ncbi:hypothetical protein P154DRAFT_525755 [Amniculicola lignicola CBS 123094]|uniref:Uncharacterized protein n=1 Tax=Amniculicola lignicola CBS 123094 TaxID=1392246 RepID=A0A6A5W2W7_9PLEO|nr:hypothetical protein P154DRAFT_525755 [Amniculicola lignicola CBS 123094]